MVVASVIPPKDQQAEEFDGWALHWFIHVTEEEGQKGFFVASNFGGVNQLGLHKQTPTLQMMPLQLETVLTEIVQLLESHMASRSIGFDNDDAKTCPQHSSRHG